MAKIGNIGTDISSIIATINQLADDIEAVNVPTTLSSLSEDSTHRLTNDDEKEKIEILQLFTYNL